MYLEYQWLSVWSLLCSIEEVKVVHLRHKGWISIVEDKIISLFHLPLYCLGTALTFNKYHFPADLPKQRGQQKPACQTSERADLL